MSVFGLYVVMRRGLNSTMRFFPLDFLLSYLHRIATIFLSESGYPGLKDLQDCNLMVDR
jgi:hypothetical protein